MAVTTSTTRLEAVNRMLSTIGIARLSDLNATDREDQNEAEDILDEVTREVQKIGWTWNTNRDYPITAVASSFTVPTEALQVTIPRGKYPSFKGPGSRFVVRASDSETFKIYDRDNQTFTITDLSEIRVDYIKVLEFTWLPPSVRWYIVIRAARQFANRMLAGQPAIDGFSDRDEKTAFEQLQDADGEQGEFSIFDNEVSSFIVFRGRAF